MSGGRRLGGGCVDHTAPTIPPQVLTLPHTPAASWSGLFGNVRCGLSVRPGVEELIRETSSEKHYARTNGNEGAREGGSSPNPGRGIPTSLNESGTQRGSGVSSRELRPRFSQAASFNSPQTTRGLFLSMRSRRKLFFDSLPPERLRHFPSVNCG